MTVSATLLALVLGVRTVPAPEFEETTYDQGPPPQAAMPAEVPPLHQLPASVRVTLPEIKLSMLVWAEDPHRRFVTLNGERVGEGHTAGEGLWVREIRRDSVVLQFENQFFEYR